MTRPQRVLILAPMTSELKPLARYSGATPAVHPSPAFTAQVGDIEVVITRIGVGPAMAKASTARALEAFDPEHVVVSGIAGGLDPAHVVGSVVVPETVLDIASGRTYQASPLGETVPSGMVGVADRLITDEGELADLLGKGVLALEMESSGVAAACEEAGVPWTTFRVISDRIDEGLLDHDVITFLRPDGSVAPVGAALFLIAHPARIRRVLRLARDSNMAAAKAARITLGALGFTPVGGR